MKLPLTIVLSLMLANPAIGLSEERLVVITNLANQSSMTREDVYKIYHGKTTLLPNGDKVIPVVVNENSTDHQVFTEKLLKRTSSQFKAYWAKKLFTGKGKPPKTVNDAASMLELVQSTSGVIGYILTDKELPDVYQAYSVELTR